MGAITFFNLNRYISEFGTKIFCETGTGAGDGLRFAASQPFQKLFSIEIEIEHAKKLQAQFSADPRVAIFGGNSYEKLWQILHFYNFQENVLFWLDAHYPGADLFVRPYQTNIDIDVKLPLEKELEVISKLRAGRKDVILIDDLRIYEEDAFAAGNLKDLGLADIGKFNKLTLVYDLFDKTHTIRKDLSDTGYLILEPK